MYGADKIWGAAARVTDHVNRSPSLGTRLFLCALLSLVVVAFFLVLFPILIIVGLITTLAIASAFARRLMSRARNPNGVLDGRRNVRVISRTDGE